MSFYSEREQVNVSDGSIHLSRKPPGFCKSLWPGEIFSTSPNLFLSSLQNDDRDQNSKEDNNRKRKKNWHSKASNKKAGKKDSVLSSVNRNQPPAEGSKSMGARRSIKSRWSLSAITRNIKKSNFPSDFRNLSSFHYDLINDRSTFSSKKNQFKRRFGSIFPKFPDFLTTRKYLVALPLMASLLRIIKVFRKRITKLLRSERNQINPNSPFLIFWEIIIMCLSMAQLFSFSIEKCFFVNLDTRRFESFFLAALYINLLVSCNTKYFRKGNAITDRKLILKNLIAKKLFSHVAPCFCFSLIVFSEIDSYSFLNLVLLLKIVKDEKLGQRLKDLLIRTREGDAIYQMVILIIKIFSWAHIIAVLWHYVAVNTSRANPETNTWLKAQGIEGKDWGTRYLFSIYWSLTTMLTVGYDDITPTNPFEMVYNIFAMFVGCCMFGFSLNKIGEIMKHFHRKQNYLDEQTSKVSFMLRNKNYPLETQSKIKRYLEFFWRQELKEDPENENFIMNKLSSELRNEMFLHSNVVYLKRVPAFRNLGDRTLIALSQHMKKICYSPEEFVYRVGEYENPYVYFVLDGNLKLVTVRDDKILNVLKGFKKEDYFGEREIFTGGARSMAVVSTDFSTLFRLSRADLVQVLKKFPSDYEIFCQTRDLDILYSKYDHYNMACLSCGQKDHPLEKCEFIRYTPIQRLIIHKHLWREKMRASEFRRKKFKSHHALLDAKIYSLAQDAFLELYQEDDEVIGLKKLYSLDEELDFRTFVEKSRERERGLAQALKKYSTLKESLHREKTTRTMSRNFSRTSNKMKFGNSEDSNIKSNSSKDIPPSACEKKMDELLNLVSNVKEYDEDFGHRREHSIKYQETSDYKRDDTRFSLEMNRYLKNKTSQEEDALAPSRAREARDQVGMENFIQQSTRQTLLTDGKYSSDKKTVIEPEPKEEIFGELQTDAIRIFQLYFPHNNFTELKRCGKLN